MKFKHVFQLWFWADLILAAGGSIFALIVSNGDFSSIGFALLIALYGIGISLPSLIMMLIFHSIYSRNDRDTSNYVEVYSIVILVINVLYLVVSYFPMHLGKEFSLLYIGTTAAGFLSLYIVHRRIKKALAIAEERDSGDLL